MPVLIAIAPPEILQATPELVRLLDAANFRAARDFRFCGQVEDRTAQRLLQTLRKLLVIRAECRRGKRGRGRGERVGCVSLLHRHDHRIAWLCDLIVVVQRLSLKAAVPSCIVSGW